MGGRRWQRKSDGATVSAVRDKEGEREASKTEQQERRGRGEGEGWRSETTGVLRERSERVSECGGKINDCAGRKQEKRVEAGG